MLGYAREDKMRSKLREAILAGFNPASLDEVLLDKSPSLTATGGGVAIGRDAIGTTITTVPPNPVSPAK